MVGWVIRLVALYTVIASILSREEIFRGVPYLVGRGDIHLKNMCKSNCPKHPVIPGEDRCQRTTFTSVEVNGF